MRVILVRCSQPANAVRALAWAISLCQLATMRLAAQEDAGELVEHALSALEAYQDTVLERPRIDVMFCSPWTAR